MVDINGVTVVGLGNLPNYVCRDASVMYSNNLFNLVEDTWDKEAGTSCSTWRTTSCPAA
jgi:NAD(P) transhydrogenase subunit alpha